MRVPLCCAVEDQHPRAAGVGRAQRRRRLVRARAFPRAVDRLEALHGRPNAPDQEVDGEQGAGEQSGLSRAPVCGTSEAGRVPPRGVADGGDRRLPTPRQPLRQAGEVVEDGGEGFGASGLVDPCHFGCVSLLSWSNALVDTIGDSSAPGFAAIPVLSPRSGGPIDGVRTRRQICRCRQAFHVSGVA